MPEIVETQRQGETCPEGETETGLAGFRVLSSRRHLETNTKKVSKINGLTPRARRGGGRGAGARRPPGRPEGVLALETPFIEAKIEMVGGPEWFGNASKIPFYREKSWNGSTSQMVLKTMEGLGVTAGNACVS